MRRPYPLVTTAAVLAAVLCLAGCRADDAPAEAAPSQRPTASAAALDRPPNAHCATTTVMHRRTNHVTLGVGACVSFDGYSDIEAVINTVHSTRSAVLPSIDPLTFRARTAGAATLVVESTREICTATSTCTVRNPEHRIRVMVTGH